MIGTTNITNHTHPQNVSGLKSSYIETVKLDKAENTTAKKWPTGTITSNQINEKGLNW